MPKLQLPKVTLIAVAGNKQAQTISALYKCMEQIDFARILLITNVNIPSGKIESINVGGLKTWQAYNEFIVKELDKYFDTPYCLLVQWDGYVLNANQWDDINYEFDYMGAKWLDLGKPYNVGNGGFSFRSKRLQNILARDTNITTTTPEDNAICRVYGQYLVDKYGIKFADEVTADKFAFELNEPVQPTFGFHGLHWKPYKETILIKRDYAMGDIITLEPLMAYFYKKGYNVALETMPQFYNIFQSHYFPVIPKENLNPLMPTKEIDLNLAYEINPKQNHLQSYYDLAEVPKEEREIRNPILTLPFDYKNEVNKLFPKYCVLHIDERNEPHRNIYGIDWGYIVDDLEKRGYTVIQIGMGKHEVVKGAVQMRTPQIQLLMWVIASSDLFIGIDSAPAHIASGFGVPSIMLFGSVQPECIYQDFTNKICIHNHDRYVCERPFCWGDAISESGVECYIDKQKPPCTQFSNSKIIEAINKITNDKRRMDAVQY